MSSSSVKSEPLQEKKVWYLAYGSNLNPNVLVKRRGVHPEESIPCKIPGYKLEFTVPGFPYFEPCFANISLSSQTSVRQEQESITSSSNNDHNNGSSQHPPLHGVAHKITQTDLSKILETEGGGGYAGLGYTISNIPVITYDGRTLETVTLLWHSGSSAIPTAIVPQPSKRYLQLMVDGAAFHGVDASYQDWLSRNPYYVGQTSFLQKLGGYCILGLNCTVGSPVFFSFYISKYFQRRAPRLSYVLFDYLITLNVFVHQYFLSSIFGCGMASPINSSTYLRANTKVVEEQQQGNLSEDEDRDDTLFKSSKDNKKKV